METYLETERLVLRPLTADDEDELVALDNDPEVMRYLNGGRPVSREKIRDEILPRMMSDGFHAAVEKTSGGFIGWFHLRPREGGLELGYRLRRDSWGRGLATEGAKALVHKAFTELGADRVYAETMAVNTGSRRVMEKAGLTFVRTFHETFDDPIDGVEHGEVEYALTRAEWGHSR